MLKIVVLLKQTFDTEEKIIVTPQGVDESEAKFVINPYDEYALEEAILLRERHGGQVIVVTCGPERAQDALRTALAVGADEAIRIDSRSLPDDGYTAAAALAAVIKPLAPDLLLAGLFAVDSGAGSVALQVAQRLGLPHASSAIKLSIITGDELSSFAGSANAGGKEAGGAVAGGTVASALAGIGSLTEPPSPQRLFAERYALVERDVEGDTETVSLPLPALITAQQGLNEPRYPSLPGIMKAKKKPLRTVAVEELLGGDRGSASAEPRVYAGVAAGGLLDIYPRTVRTQLLPPPPRASGQRLGGTPVEQAAALVALLQSEAKLL